MLPPAATVHAFCSTGSSQSWGPRAACDPCKSCLLAAIISLFMRVFQKQPIACLPCVDTDISVARSLKCHLFQHEVATFHCQKKQAGVKDVWKICCWSAFRKIGSVQQDHGGMQSQAVSSQWMPMVSETRIATCLPVPVSYMGRQHIECYSW